MRSSSYGFIERHRLNSVAAPHGRMPRLRMAVMHSRRASGISATVRKSNARSAMCHTHSRHGAELFLAREGHHMVHVQANAHALTHGVVVVAGHMGHHVVAAVQAQRVEKF